MYSLVPDNYYEKAYYMKYAYFPGCTGESTSAEYDESVKEVAGILGIEFDEIPGWTCCGSSSAHILDHELSLALPGRNLALAEKMSLPVVASCPACSSRLKKTEYELSKNPDIKKKIEHDIGMQLSLSHKSKHILEILYHDVGLESIKEKITRPLEGLNVVTYYGCYLVRPPEVMKFDNHENPVIMDEIMKAAGANVMDWSFKVDCCGGSLSIVTPEIVEKLSNKIVQGAKDARADMIVSACGICQLNLDMRQPEKEDTLRIPVLYFSELLAHAMGSTSLKKWAIKHFANPLPVLRTLGLIEA